MPRKAGIGGELLLVWLARARVVMRSSARSRLGYSAPRLRAWAVFLLACTAACGGRVDLDAAKKFASLADSAQKISDQMASDFYDTCLVRREYAGVTRLGVIGQGVEGAPLSSGPLIGPLATVPPEPAAMPTPTTTPSSPASRQKPESTPAPMPSAETGCDAVQQNSTRFKLYNAAVFAYVRGISAIAKVDTAPNKATYDALGKDLSSLGVDSGLGKAAAEFVRAIGQEVIKHKQDQDIRNIVAASQQDHVLDSLITALRTDVLRAYSISLANEKRDVDVYYYTLINVEAIRLVYLRQLNGDVSDAPKLSSDQYKNKRFKIGDFRLGCSRQPRGCDNYIARALTISQLRDKILTQRARWFSVDSQISANANRIPPYYSILGDIQKVNSRLVAPARPGIAGLIDAVAPVVSDLGDSATALVNAARASPMPTKGSGAARSPTPRVGHPTPKPKG